MNTIPTPTSRIRTFSVSLFPDLAEQFRTVSETYASTDDGGYPGTGPAISYRTECDRIWAEAAARTASIVRLVNGGAK